MGPPSASPPDDFRGLLTENGWALVEASVPYPTDVLDLIVHSPIGSAPEAPRAIRIWSVDDAGMLSLGPEIGPYGWDPYFGENTVMEGEDRYGHRLDVKNGRATFLIVWYGIEPIVRVEPLDPKPTLSLLRAGVGIQHEGPLAPGDIVGGPRTVDLSSAPGSLVLLRIRGTPYAQGGEWALRVPGAAQPERSGTFGSGGSFISAIVEGPAEATFKVTPPAVEVAEMYVTVAPLPEGLFPPQLSLKHSVN